MIPLCNLESDAQSFVIDTLFARNLFMSKHLVWYSDSSQPDLGGHEDQNFRLYNQDDIENPELNSQGFYRSYCVEINIQQLALNTVLMSDQMPEFENLFNQTISTNKNTKQDQNFAIVAGHDFDADLDEFVSCATAF